MYINGIGFLTTISHPLYYRTSHHVEDNTTENFYKVLDKVLRIYNSGGFRVEQIDCDGEFKSLMDQVADELEVQMNYTNAQDHVPAAERNNRTLKESYRVTLHRTGYKIIPKAMIIALGEQVAKRLNMFPAKNGISEYYSPETIVTGRMLDYKKHLQHEFGEYVQGTNQNNPTRSMIERCIDGIYLYPNMNKQGGHVIMNLSTGRVLTRN